MRTILVVFVVLVLVVVFVPPYIARLAREQNAGGWKYWKNAPLPF